MKGTRRRCVQKMGKFWRDFSKTRARKERTVQMSFEETERSGEFILNGLNLLPVERETTRSKFQVDNK